MEDYVKIPNKRYPEILLRVFKGHFVTPNSHVNYFIDMSALKARQSEANAIAEAIAEQYSATTTVDTILCLDGCEVIGAYLAEHLTKTGILSTNAHKTLYITVPEFGATGELVFRDNIKPMIKGKHILILLANATTGKTLSNSIDLVKYYGGIVTGVSAIFSAATSVAGMPIYHLFDSSDIPDYHSYPHHDCALCKAGVKVDAICNSFGYSKIE